MLKSGCTKHVINNIDNYLSYTQFGSPSVATLADLAKTQMKTYGSGLVQTTTTINGETSEIILNDVLYCPTITNQTVSITSIDRKGFFTVFGNGQAQIIQSVKINGKVYGQGTL